jgi:translocator protein
MEYLYWITHQFDFGSRAVSTVQYQDWYALLAKPFFAPPPWLFGVAWGIIYPLIIIALLYALYLYFKKRISLGFIGVFALNLALNLTFTPTLIVTQNNALISLHILLVLLTLLWLISLAWKRSKLVFWLLIPYVLWGTFATILQLTITVLN